MKFYSPISLKWMSTFINAELVGSSNEEITGINELHNVKHGDLVFVDHPKYYETCLNSEASFIIINKKVNPPLHKVLLVVNDPFESYLKIVNHFRPFEASLKMVSESAIIGEGSIIMPNVFLGNNVIIGKNSIIHPNVTVYDNCTIGNNVIIHSGTIIGSDAFYYNTQKKRETWYKKMASCGTTIIEDDVEIGANCTIDRGVSSETIIGRGTKLDNLIHIGHEVVIGCNCLIAAGVGIAGCTILEDGVTLWGQVGVNKTVRIGANAIVMGQSGVSHDLEPGKIYWGTPAEEFVKKRRELIWIKRIPEIWDRLNNVPKKNSL